MSHVNDLTTGLTVDHYAVFNVAPSRKLLAVGQMATTLL
jgi:hypothetical protein